MDTRHLEITIDNLNEQLRVLNNEQTAAYEEIGRLKEQLRHASELAWAEGVLAANYVRRPVDTVTDNPYREK